MTITSEKPPTVDELLQAAEQLDDADLTRLYAGLGRMRQPKVGSVLSAQETELLERINRGIPQPLEDEYQQLQDKQREGRITELERQELLRLVHVVEGLNVEWLRAMIDLAAVRGLTLDELQQQLGIPAHAVRA